MLRKSKNEYLNFLIKYFAFISIYYLLLLIPNNFIFEKYLEFSAQLSSFILNIFSFNTAVTSDIISNIHFSVQISFGCEGTEPIMLFTAGLLAYNSNFIKKLPWLLIGNLLLFSINIIRIVFLFIIGANYGRFFEDFHIIYFPIAVIIISILFFLLWIRFAKK